MNAEAQKGVKFFKGVKEETLLKRERKRDSTDIRNSIEG